MARTKSKSKTNNKNLNPTKSTPLLTAGFRKAPGAKVKILRKKLTIQIKEKILKLLQRGVFSYGDIAIKLDRARSSVQWVIQQHKKKIGNLVQG